MADDLSPQMRELELAVVSRLSPPSFASAASATRRRSLSPVNHEIFPYSQAAWSNLNDFISPPADAPVRVPACVDVTPPPPRQSSLPPREQAVGRLPPPQPPVANTFSPQPVAVFSVGVGQHAPPPARPAEYNLPSYSGAVTRGLTSTQPSDPTPSRFRVRQEAGGFAQAACKYEPPKGPPPPTRFSDGWQPNVRRRESGDVPRTSFGVDAAARNRPPSFWDKGLIGVSGRNGAADESSGDSSTGDERFVTRHSDNFRQATEEQFNGATFVDTHCHFDFLFDKLRHRGSLADLRRANRQTWSSAFEGCIPDWCEPAALLVEEGARGGGWPSLITDECVLGAAFGCHPHFADAYNDELHAAIATRLSLAKCIAVGECGLDFSYKNSKSYETQKSALEQQLKLGEQFAKPVVIHCRGDGYDRLGRGDAETLCLDIVKKGLPKYHRIHRHCFTLGMVAARRWLDEFPNLYIGLTPLVVNPRERSAIMEVVREAPLDRLLIETDSPFFLPKFYESKSFGGLRHCHPGIGVQVALTIAQERNMPVERVLRQIRANTHKLYGV